MEIVLRFPDWPQRELSVLREKGRHQGLPIVIGRQLLAWGLRKCRDEIRDKNTAHSAMNSLRGAIRKSPPGRPQFRRLLQAVENNLVLESAEDMSDEEMLGSWRS